MAGCTYIEAYRGKCNKRTVENSKFCKEHKDKSCSYDSCENTAVKGCTHAVSLVCGRPICDENSWCPSHN